MVQWVYKDKTVAWSQSRPFAWDCKVAIVAIENPLELYIFPPYCARSNWMRINGIPLKHTKKKKSLSDWVDDTKKDRRSKLIYCPYADQDLAIEQCSHEHIVPLALGGTNGFEIPVCAALNSKVDSEIDGAMASDFLTMTKRNKYDIRGHSRQRPAHIIKSAYDAETLAPLQIYLDQRDGLKVWNPIDKKFITENRPRKLGFKFKVDLDLHFRFTAKVALAAGYFAYGELFRTTVKHSDFRAIMNHQSGAPSEHLSHVEALADSMFYQTKSKRLELIRALCKASSPYSIIGLVPSRDNFGVFVGILGDYIGMLTVAADTSGFPNEGVFRWGHVIQLQPKKGIARSSLMKAMSTVVIKAHHQALLLRPAKMV